jgi:cell division protein FtsX
MMVFISVVAKLLGWSVARLIATLATIAVSLILVSGFLVKLYMAGVNAERIKQERASHAAIVRSLENDTRQAKADALKAQAEAEQAEKLLNELQNGDDACLDPATVERLRKHIGR